MSFSQFTNVGRDFDVCRNLFDQNVNMPAVEQNISSLSKRTGKDKTGQIASLLRAVTCIDLTTLCGDDTVCNVLRLCNKAVNPIHEDIHKLLEIDYENLSFHVGAICVYPARVADCVNTLKSLGSEIPVAAVAAGFPSGQYHMDSKLDEIQGCIKDGANEIDIVISRDLVINAEWEKLYEEVKSFKEVCGNDVLLKTIIAAGELGSLDNIYRASIVCMAAGADFIKTSTGKESVNATLPIGMTMVRAIKNYYFDTGYQVGFKPAGGIRTVNDVFLWQALMKKELGSKWLFPELFRIGASGLLSDIEQSIFQHVKSYPASKSIFSYQ